MNQSVLEQIPRWSNGRSVYHRQKLIHIYLRALGHTQMGRRRSRTRGKKSGGLSRRAAIGLIGAAGAVGLGTVYGTGAFERVNSIRQSDVGAASDSNALLGIEEKSPSGTDGDRVTLLKLTNNFAETIDSVDVSVVDSGDLTLSKIVTPNSIAPDQSGSVTAKISCPGKITEQVDLDIRAKTSGSIVSVIRSVTVTCQAPSLDPKDCEDVWKMACDYNEGPRMQIQNQTKGGSVCIDQSGTVGVQLQKGSTISSFLRITTGQNVNQVHLQENSVIEGALAIKACKNVNSILLQGTKEDNGSEIKGDVCIKAGGKVDVTLEQTSIIHRDLKIDADGPVSVTIVGDSKVEGTINKNWNSGWTNDNCGN